MRPWLSRRSLGASCLQERLLPSLTWAMGFAGTSRWRRRRGRGGAVEPLKLQSMKRSVRKTLLIIALILNIGLIPLQATTVFTSFYSACAIAIIGGADGPTSIYIGQGELLSLIFRAIMVCIHIYTIGILIMALKE